MLQATCRSTRSRAAGPNGAIRSLSGERGRPTERIERGQLYLVDSGGQYQDGTTDVTRTIAIGTPTARDARPLHPGAEGPYRARRAVFPRARAAASSTCSRGNIFGRRGSTMRTAPATASAATCRCTRGRSASPPSAAATSRLHAGHDPLERARLLQAGRVRHPHREPRARRGEATCPAPSARCSAFETLTLRADRPGAESTSTCSTADESAAGSTPIMRASAT